MVFTDNLVLKSYFVSFFIISSYFSILVLLLSEVTRFYRGFSFYFIKKYWDISTIFGKVLSVLFCIIFIIPDFFVIFIFKSIQFILILVKRTLIKKNGESLSLYSELDNWSYFFRL